MQKRQKKHIFCLSFCEKYTCKSLFASVLYSISGKNGFLYPMTEKYFYEKNRKGKPNYR